MGPNNKVGSINNHQTMPNQRVTPENTLATRNNTDNHQQCLNMEYWWNRHGMETRQQRIAAAEVGECTPTNTKCRPRMSPRRKSLPPAQPTNGHQNGSSKTGQWETK